MKIAVVGATGLVGGMMLQLLEAYKLPVTELIPVASAQSVGKNIVFKGQNYPVVAMETAVSLKPDIALFSAGGQTSLAWAEAFAAVGCCVIDNSSAWRMHPDVKLIVPEINGSTLTKSDLIIANPNCSTIQMVMVLRPLQLQYGIKRVVVSTYQSVSGTGQKGVNTLEAQRAGNPDLGAYPHPIDMNVIPQVDVFLENGYTKEEIKMVQETCKILGDDTIKVSATTVRVPVVGGHSESVNIELLQPYEMADVVNLLQTTPGVTVMDQPAQNIYPTPLFAAGKDNVFVGRLRRDDTQPNTLNCWIVADNLRKGAATNAVQIAAYRIAQGW